MFLKEEISGGWPRGQLFLGMLGAIFPRPLTWAGLWMTSSVEMALEAKVPEHLLGSGELTLSGGKLSSPLRLEDEGSAHAHMCYLENQGRIGLR